MATDTIIITTITIMSTDTTIIPEAVTAATEEALIGLRTQEHSGCFACRPRRWGGLELSFKVAEDNSVITEWICPPIYESYEGVVHGGILATVMDCSMVQALFARGVVARTGELSLRYHAPVEILAPVQIRAWMCESKGPLYLMKSELHQYGRLCVRAHSKFMQTPLASASKVQAGKGDV